MVVLSFAKDGTIIPIMPYRRTDKVEARLASDRERILATARRLVTEGGFREAQIAAVAAMAEVGVGTIYRHFPSKADLFAEVVSAVSRREVGIVDHIAESGGRAPQRLADALRTFATRALRSGRLANALIAEPAEPAVDEARLRYRRDLGRSIAGILEDGVQAGELPRQDVEASAACVVGALLEGLVGPLAPSGRIGRDGPRQVDAIVAFCVRAVSGTTA
jgi:AcrR family transcriptional regulator